MFDNCQFSVEHNLSRTTFVRFELSNNLQSNIPTVAIFLPQNNAFYDLLHIVPNSFYVSFSRQTWFPIQSLILGFASDEEVSRSFRRFDRVRLVSSRKSRKNGSTFDAIIKLSVFVANFRLSGRTTSGQVGSGRWWGKSNKKF